MRRVPWIVIGLFVLPSACAVAANDFDDGVIPDARRDGTAEASGDGDRDDTNGADSGRVDAGKDSGVDGAVDSRPDVAGDGATDTKADTGGGTPDSTTLTCGDDEYDVDGDPTNGCEVPDPATPFELGGVSECDGAPFGYGWKTYKGTFASDERMHTPSGASGTTGKPHEIGSSHVDDALCTNDAVYKLSFGSGTRGTYRLTVLRDGTEDSACSPRTIVGGSSAEATCSDHEDGDRIVFRIEKLSGPAENASFDFQFHN
jgi:hypothetical protein